MLVVGRGQLGKAFQSERNDEVVVLASGVSDSSCTDAAEFEREKQLIRSQLENNIGKKFVYFSSCALSAGEGYADSAYYQHKMNMERLIKLRTSHFYIFRIPQLFGCFFSHKTLINFFYKSILDGLSFKVYDDAYRYLIHIDDVKKLVLAYLDHSGPLCVDLANPYRYKVLDIVHDLEEALGKPASYELIRKTDKYFLDLKDMQRFISVNDISLDFGKDYFSRKLAKHLDNSV